MFLDRAELTGLTGYRQRGKVRQWLTENGYQFEIAADGWPRVLRSAVEARLMPATRRSKMSANHPDFSIYGAPKKAA